MALAAASVAAQTSRGSVAGLVQDPSGVAVAANLETGVVRLTLSARNFSVLAGQAFTVDARTEIGDVQATVEVSAEGVALQTGQTTTQSASAACVR